MKTTKRTASRQSTALQFEVFESRRVLTFAVTSLTQFAEIDTYDGGDAQAQIYGSQSNPATAAVNWQGGSIRADTSTTTTPLSFTFDGSYSVADCHATIPNSFTDTYGGAQGYFSFDVDTSVTFANINSTSSSFWLYTSSGDIEIPAATTDMLLPAGYYGFSVGGGVEYRIDQLGNEVSRPPWNLHFTLSVVEGDLQAAYSSPPSEFVTVGGDIDAALRITNVGPGCIGFRTVDPLISDFYLSKTPTLDDDAILLGSRSKYLFPTHLKSGEWADVSIHYTIPSFVTPGVYYLITRINSDRRVDESNYDNNVISSASISETVRPKVTIRQATTHDAKSVSVNFTVANAAVHQPLRFDVYRSSKPTLDATATLLGGQILDPVSDTADLSLGSHTLTLLSGTELEPDPLAPYVIVVANSDESVDEAVGSINSAYFRKFVLGAVVHGFPFTTSNATPDWESQTASDLNTYGHYDEVIAFNWMGIADNPSGGNAITAGNYLASDIEAKAATLAAAHSGDIVDLHLIGHSRGAAVVSAALQKLQQSTNTALQGAYIKVTLLDPHPANLSTLALYSGLIPLAPAWFALYQSISVAAHDPQVTVASNVQFAEVYYQKSSFLDFLSSNPAAAVMNLWGEGPKDGIHNASPSFIHWHNLTDIFDRTNDPLTQKEIGAIGHSEVHEWYRVHVVDQSRSLSVRDASVNQPPRLDAIPDPSPLPMNAGAQSIVLGGISAGPSNERGQTVTLSVVSNNPGLIPSPAIAYVPLAGIGAVSYTPKPGMAGTATIAVIAQDNGGADNGGVDATIRTFVVTVASPPGSQIASLPSINNLANFTVAWSGSTDTSGVSIKSYDVYLSTDGAPYVRWLKGVSETSHWFKGQSGHRYSFYSRALDSLNQREAAPAVPDAVTYVNTAPVLDANGNPTLGVIAEDAKAPAGVSVISLVAGVTDVDAGGQKGVAIVGGTTGKGVWQFFLAGSSGWQVMPPMTTSNALLLSADSGTKIRFVPKSDFNGIAKLWYRAWDRTQGTAGAMLQTAGSVGGSKSLSIAMESATLTITPVDDAPVLTMSGTVGYVHDRSPIVLAPFASVSDIDNSDFAGGRLRVTIASGISTSNRLSIGSGFSVDGEGNLMRGTTVVGKRISNGVGTADLVVGFRASSTKWIVQQLVRAIIFKTVGGAAGLREAVFTISDGDGGISKSVSKRIDVR